jgi:2-C-methyl-D-erythritol 2,4-cyclodiphosphate synthase
MSDYRIGYGEDIHRLIEGDHLLLAGVRIPFGKTALAHSDGDVVYHAVADALLGSLALGDIGELFPPSDKKTVGLDSALIVKKAVNLVGENGYRVTNIDVVIQLERPNVASYKAAMRSNLANLLGVSLGAVSVKAGTNEGLDAIGKGEAAKAVAVVLVEKAQ